ncbi:hypothetical protein AB0F91_15965 [Amycolatopsis sp. NPDC023774]|uniref:hypothetical protein n=1 Tax=Amycolatopsis sp. NPDC023774 TaxID=3155015 RepID=UPI0033CBE3D7
MVDAGVAGGFGGAGASELGVSDAVVDAGSGLAEADVAGAIEPDVGVPLVPPVPGTGVPPPGVDDEGCFAYGSTEGTPDSGSD